MEHWGRTGTTGRGVEMVRGRRDPEEDAAAFAVDRVTNPLKKKQPPNNLVFRKCSFKRQQGLLAARETEWEQLKSVNAARLVNGAEL